MKGTTAVWTIHITPALYELHWLPIANRIKFKILILSFKSIYGLVPSYLSSLSSKRAHTRYTRMIAYHGIACRLTRMFPRHLVFLKVTLDVFI